MTLFLPTGSASCYIPLHYISDSGLLSSVHDHDSKKSTYHATVASGDLLQITPTSRALQRKVPDAQVDIMVGSCNDRLCRQTPQLERMALITLDEVFAAAAESGSGVKPCRW